MSRTFKDRFHYKGWDKKRGITVKYVHHGEYHEGQYRPQGRAWWLKPASWFTNLYVTRALRRDWHQEQVGILKASSFDQLEDSTSFKYISKPNADWDWA